MAGEDRFDSFCLLFIVPTCPLASTFNEVICNSDKFPARNILPTTGLKSTEKPDTDTESVAREQTNDRTRATSIKAYINRFQAFADSIVTHDSNHMTRNEFKSMYPDVL